MGILYCYNERYLETQAFADSWSPISSLHVYQLATKLYCASKVNIISNFPTFDRVTRRGIQCSLGELDSTDRQTGQGSPHIRHHKDCQSSSLDPHDSGA